MFNSFFFSSPYTQPTDHLLQVYAGSSTSQLLFSSCSTPSHYHPHLAHYEVSYLVSPLPFSPSYPLSSEQSMRIFKNKLAILCHCPVQNQPVASDCILNKVQIPFAGPCLPLRSFLLPLPPAHWTAIMLTFIQFQDHVRIIAISGLLHLQSPPPRMLVSPNPLPRPPTQPNLLWLTLQISAQKFLCQRGLFRPAQDKSPSSITSLIYYTSQHLSIIILWLT